MNKISGILPSTSRVTAVDMKSAQPIRPGQPAFGRPVGRSGDIAKITRKVAGRNPIATHQDIMSIRNKGERHQAIVEKMSNAFFMKNREEAPAVVVDRDFSATALGPHPMSTVLEPVYQEPSAAMSESSLEASFGPSSSPMTVEAELQAEDSLDAPYLGAQLDVVA